MDDAALSQFFASFTRLDDDDVKLIGYTIVYLDRGEEHIVEGGSGQVLVVESTSEKNLIALLIADWAKKSLNDELAKRVSRRPFEPKYLDVDYKVVKRWPRRELEFQDREVEQFEKIAKAVEKRTGRPVVRLTPRDLQ